jgi:GTP-binding protein
MLGRRGEDPRFTESWPAAQRRRAIDEAMPERSETETRADVARRLDRDENEGSGDDEEGDAVLIGEADNAVVFDFKPMMSAGAEILGRRGEDNRFAEDRPAAQRRRAIEEAMASRAEGETRADVARRFGLPGGDPDASPDDAEETWGWDEDDPGEPE